LYGYLGKSLAAGSGQNHHAKAAPFYPLGPDLGKHGRGGHFGLSLRFRELPSSLPAHFSRLRILRAEAPVGRAVISACSISADNGRASAAIANLLN
jgi:hypothetical protein